MAGRPADAIPRGSAAPAFSFVPFGLPAYDPARAATGAA